jgi:DNA-binding winged helix-turn-helix (wHTH) protein/tetratricopeptide (TPR) repeat protein
MFIQSHRPVYTTRTFCLAMGALEHQRVVRFGVFSFDPRAGELCKKGRKLKIQGQPIEILAMLLDRPGEIITREEFQKRLWPADTFVDFEHSLNAAVKRLRDAMGDSADAPQYVETLARRGYRFIGEIQSDVQLQEIGRGKNAQSVATTPASADPTEGLIEPLPPSQIHWRRARVWAFRVVAALIVTLLAAGLYVRYRRPSHLTDKDTIVLADFANTTGDAAFDDTLKTALSVSLRQSPFLNVLSDSEVTKTLQLMVRPVSTKLTPEVARELCQRAGSKAYLAGSIGTLGSEYVMGLKVVNCQSGDSLGEEQVTAGSKEKVLDALGQAASKLRGELGESLAMVQRFNVPLEQATTPSVEALKAYSLGIKAFSEKGAAAALTYHQHAIEVDPNFAMGYSAVGYDYFALGEVGLETEYFTKAFQLREHVSEREKLSITAEYYRSVTGELDKAARINQEWIESYPRDSRAYFNLGYVYSLLGQYEKAKEITTQGMLLAPDQVDNYELLAVYALALQRFDEARQILHEAQARKLDDYLLHNDLYALAFLGADSAAMGEQQQWFATQPEYSNIGLTLESDTDAYAGHFGKAREMTKRAVNSAVRVDNKEYGGIYLAITAQQQAAYGNPAEARQTAAEALKLAPASQGVDSEVALAFAMAGETARAEALAQDLGRRFPLDTQMQSLWLPVILAQVALDKTNSAAALDGLQTASATELGQIPFVNNPSCLYPVYVRGEAYLADRQGNAAAAEFQKILNHSGIVTNCWTGALAHLGVAQANALESRTAKGADAAAARVRALAAYKDFLTLWKDADPDIPILKQAKAEYVKLE